MATVTRTTTWSDNQVLTATALNNEFNNLFNALALTNSDISGSAAIAYSKLNLTSSILESDLNLADNTTADVSITKHGFVPKAPNSTTKFLRGDATWTTVSSLTSQVITSTRDMTSASGNVSYTGVGFKPTVILCNAGLNATTTGHTVFGFSDSAITTGGKALAIIDSTNTYSYQNGLILIEPTAGNNQAASILTYDTDGFTLSWTKTGSPTGSATLVFLCLK